MIRKDKSVQKAIEVVNAQLGREMPQAIEIEEAILANILLEPDVLTVASSILSPDSFYLEKNQIIYKTMLDLRDKKLPYDNLSLLKELKDQNKLEDIGGAGALVSLMRGDVRSYNIEHYSRIVEQEKIRRKLIVHFIEATSKAYDGTLDVHDVITGSQKELHDLQLIPFDSMKKAPEMVKELYGRMKYNYANDGAITGKPYGIKSLDRFTSGIQTTDLTLIAGEPSMGKTSLAVSITNNLTRTGEKAALISLEMSSIQIIARITAQETGISSKAILSWKLEDHQLAIIDSQAEQISNRPLFVDPDCSSELSSILSTIRFMNEKFGVKVFFVDYIQLITIANERGNREGQLATIARSLKNLAKELDIAIIALSQLNRDKNKTELPSMNRLRGSGQLEEAADNIIFVHRPEYHGQDYMPDETTLAEGKALLIIAKGRNIGTTQLTVNFEKETGLFSEDKVTYDFGDYNPDKYHESNKPF